MKDTPTYLCPECGRELSKGQKCPECERVAHREKMIVETPRRSRRSLFKVID